MSIRLDGGDALTQVSFDNFRSEINSSNSYSSQIDLRKINPIEMVWLAVETVRSSQNDLRDSSRPISLH